MTIDTKRFPALAYVAEADPGSLAVVFDHYVERYGEHPAPDLFAFGEKITAELATRDAEIRREAAMVALNVAAEFWLIAKGKTRSIAIERVAEVVDEELRNPHTATDAEQAEAEKAEDA